MKYSLLIIMLFSTVACSKIKEYAEQKQKEEDARKQALVAKIEQTSKFVDCVEAADTDEKIKACEDLKPDELKKSAEDREKAEWDNFTSPRE